MQQLTTYKVTFKETKDQWIFQYDLKGLIYCFTNVEGTRILKLFENRQFPETIQMIENWVKLKNLVTVELILDDYSFEAFWIKYNLKVKKELSQKAFDKLDFVDKIKCFNKLGQYDAFLTQSRQAKAHMVTWINQKRYNDEY